MDRRSKKHPLQPTDIPSQAEGDLDTVEEALTHLGQAGGEAPAKTAPPAQADDTSGIY